MESKANQDNLVKTERVTYSDGYGGYGCNSETCVDSCRFCKTFREMRNLAGKYEDLMQQKSENLEEI